MNTSSTNPPDINKAKQSARERLQREVLRALTETDFYDRAAFFGGTSLRIFQGLGRYSEDLDFISLQTVGKTGLVPYGEAIVARFRDLGLNLSVAHKITTGPIEISRMYVSANAIEALRFLGAEEPAKGFPINHNELIKIKFEVDNIPMPYTKTELLSVYPEDERKVRVLDLPSLFSGKLSALLFRQWNRRIKGRDFFDYLFYINKGIKANLHYLSYELERNGITLDEDIESCVRALLQKRFEGVDLIQVIDDVLDFVDDKKTVLKWNRKTFLDTLTEISFDTSY